MYDFTPAELELIVNTMLKDYGLFFQPEKYSFVRQRLHSFALDAGISDYSNLVLRVSKDAELRRRLVEALVTNETWFFRHPKQFEILKREILPELISEGYGKIRIWSAGCSNGAEAYSVLFLLLEAIKASSSERTIDILATDISRRVLESARRGRYNLAELKEVDACRLSEYFERIDSESYVVKSQYREMVNFEKMNLFQDWPKQQFDIILCRNTMIYFKREDKKELSERFLKALKPGGYFFLGANESLDLNLYPSIDRAFENKSSVYKKSHMVPQKAEIFFATAGDMIKAMNLMEKNNLKFDFGENILDQDCTRSMILQEKHLERVLSIFQKRSIKIKEVKRHLL
ncbi:MAG: protein-glutamate O-methyltransferase CheR [Candidatus Riflebacteria bacterium]|nr:protein-glutamate O-methyltransferase CheR [Candidatus Riflebacteria bacterium]